jgi:hypothetical protein
MEKNKIDRFITYCDCGSPDHLLVFDYYKDDVDKNWDSIDVYFSSTWYPDFWKRLKLCFAYLFNKESFRLSDTVMFTKSNIDQLENLISFLKDRVDVNVFPDKTCPSKNDWIITTLKENRE